MHCRKISGSNHPNNYKKLKDSYHPVWIIWLQNEKMWVKNNVKDNSVNCRKLNALKVKVHWRIDSVLLSYYKIRLYFSSNKYSVSITLFKCCRHQRDHCGISLFSIYKFIPSCTSLHCFDFYIFESDEDEALLLTLNFSTEDIFVYNCTTWRNSQIFLIF